MRSLSFIDWLSISQAHPVGSLPLAGSEFIVNTSIQTGEIVSQSGRGYEHGGSFETGLHVRCDGTFVSVSGNPSAFCRPDNLFGVSTMREAVQVYNGVLESLGLPPFKNLTENDKNSGRGSTVWYDSGAVTNREGMLGLFRSMERLS